MITKQYEWKALGVSAQTSLYTEEKKTTECHAMVHVTAEGETFEKQFARISQGITLLLKELGTTGLQPVAQRYFLSDIANQSPFIEQRQGFVSLIQQPPLDGSKVAVWLYLLPIGQMNGRQTSDITQWQHNGYTHLWVSGLQSAGGSSAQQTTRLLQQYKQLLADEGMNLKEHCRRTWFFVRDIDTHYAGLVEARKQHFTEQGLTEQTHYIASTGICGSPQQTGALVQLEAYAAQGLQPEQQQFLVAPSCFNPTIHYGVTFERGTALHYGDRTHLFISGTASINNKGEVLYPGDVKRQTQRVWHNIEALLNEADATNEDIMQLIVYLRDPSDFAVVDSLMKQAYPHVPYVIVLAPVCRPAWLIEMECIAVTQATHPTFADF